MYPTAPDLADKDTLNILPWEDAKVEAIGFDARNEYAETFWLPILGPSTLLLLRNIAQRFDDEPSGLIIDIEETASALGIGSRRGRNSAFHRSVNRIVNFGMARTVDDDTLEVRRIIPPLHSGQVRRLTPGGQRLHDKFMSARQDASDEDLLRATKVATTLLRLGDSPDLVEQQLVVWGVQPTAAKTAVDHAWANKAREDNANAFSTA